MSTIQEIMTALSEGEAAKARVPELETHMKAMQNNIDALAKHNQELELRAKAREAVIADQLSSISKLREERDDASFRELEAQDKLATFAQAVGNAWGGIGNALNAVNPPKVEPVKEETTMHPLSYVGVTPQGQSTGPLPTGSPSLEPMVGKSESSQPVPEPSNTKSNPGQSEAGPTVSGQVQDMASLSPTVQLSGVGNTSDAASVPTPMEVAKPWSPFVEMPSVTEDKPQNEEASGYRPFSKPTDLPF